MALAGVVNQKQGQYKLIFSRKSQVPSNCAQNLVSGVMLCLAQIPKHFHVKPNIPDELFVDQASNLKQLVDLLICSSERLDYAAQHLFSRRRELPVDEARRNFETG